MRHKIVMEGFAFRLRPISDEDAEFILQLRSDPELNTFLHSTPISLDYQLNWLARYYERSGDWYFILERRCDSKPEGLISLYDHNTQQRCAEWGRWILGRRSLAAVESAWLIYRCAFEQLNLRKVYCRTVADNKSVVSFHDSCGISDRILLSDHFNLNGRTLDAVEHRVDESAWKLMEPRLKILAQRIAFKLQSDA